MIEPGPCRGPWRFHITQGSSHFLPEGVHERVTDYSQAYSELRGVLEREMRSKEIQMSGVESHGQCPGSGGFPVFTIWKFERLGLDISRIAQPFANR